MDLQREADLQGVARRDALTGVLQVEAADHRPVVAASQPASRTALDAEQMFAQHTCVEAGEVASS